MGGQATLSPALRWSFPSLVPAAFSQGHALELANTGHPTILAPNYPPPGPQSSTTAVLFLALPLLPSGGSCNTPGPSDLQACLYPAQAKTHPCLLHLLLSAPDASDTSPGPTPKVAPSIHSNPQDGCSSICVHGAAWTWDSSLPPLPSASLGDSCACASVGTLSVRPGAPGQMLTQLRGGAPAPCSPSLQPWSPTFPFQ